MTAAPVVEQTLAQRIHNEVDRAIQRNIKGLEYLASPAPAVGLTPKDIIYRRGTLNLYHFRPLCNDVYRMPLLLVMATTNKAYIFDLAPGQSLIEFLLRRGYDVFVIDWDPLVPTKRGYSSRITYSTSFRTASGECRNARTLRTSR
jgi:polyhydroxyalkanoate synthase